MKMLTSKNEKDLIDNHKFNYGKDVAPVVKLFGGSSCTWLLTEINPETNTAFGLCDLGHGCPELGYVSLAELKSIKFPPFGLPIERDRNWEAKKSINKYAEESRRLGFIQAY
tara:strand:+ start:324 stop:659 length:336 start_codon:yes stop_codon:yes gene_type:complete